MQKEEMKNKEAGKENIPPTPPIREKGEENKSKEEALFFVRACEEILGQILTILDERLPNRKKHKPTEEGKFVPPTLEEITAYCKERKNSVDPEAWYAFYSAKNWFIGKNKMRNWHQAIITWERRDKKETPADEQNSAKRQELNEFAQRFLK